MMRLAWKMVKPRAGNGGLPRFILAAALLLVEASIAPRGAVQAQPSLKGMSASVAAILFGNPSVDRDGFSYLQTGALVSSQNGSVPAVESGTVLFVRRASAFGARRFGGLKEFAALAHDDGFVSVYSGGTFNALKPPSAGKISASSAVGGIAAEGRDGKAQYTVRLYDSSAGVWINPALFAGMIEDRVAPKIEQVALQGSGGLFFAENGGNARKSAKNTVQKIPQGEYVISVSASDAAAGKGPISGVFRLKLLFNGAVALDKKFDAARAAERGLSFIGLEAPSTNCLDRDGRIVLGRQFIPRGKNTLELTVFDFAGNSARYAWSFTTE
jgi:hypothetical protein